MARKDFEETPDAESVGEDPAAPALNWDGETLIIVFGRITYTDSDGHQYCTPFMSQYIDTSLWQAMEGVVYDALTNGRITRHNVRLNDLCVCVTPF